MVNSLNAVRELTQSWAGKPGIYSKLENFAKSLGWYPSDIIEDKNPSSNIAGHLFVEHGLENSAVISFIKDISSYDRLTTSAQTNLLSVSYNNLVNIHIPVDSARVHGVHNLVSNGGIFYQAPIASDLRNIQSDFFEDIQGNTSLPLVYKSLDDAIISTVERWRAVISAECYNQLERENEVLSNLFNAIIFARAVEDQKRKHSELILFNDEQLLLKNYYLSETKNLFDIINKTLADCGVDIWPEQIINKADINIIGEKVSHSFFYRLFSEFYSNNSFAPYDYDFAIMSKHALSRIYEQYVSILRVDNNIDGQTSLFGQLPKAINNRNSGTYYTPQFISRFFARYLEKEIPNFHRTPIKIIEPSVGSGIFLRTVLEIKALENATPEQKKESFNNILGVDRDATACNAAKLSLSLLYLSLTNELPTSVNIINDNSLNYFGFSSTTNDSADVVISNPPFVPYASMGSDERALLGDYLSDQKQGRIDLYFAFIKIAIKCLKPGGIGMFVLPGTFLTTQSASAIRTLLTDNAIIKCIVDLTGVSVFGDVKAYPILLIFQKKLVNHDVKRDSPVTVAKISYKVGQALYEILNNRIYETEDFSIYKLPQSHFLKNEWSLTTPNEFYLKEKLSGFPKLNQFLEAKIGFIAGHKDAFIIAKADIPKGEEKIFAPYLSDREMQMYNVPKTTKLFFFFPYIDNIQLDGDTLQDKFPKTYAMLLKHKNVLSKRADVVNGSVAWWKPSRTRLPISMLAPKIVTPHLVFTPKFGVDTKGKYAVSRSPFLVVKQSKSASALSYESEENILLYFSAVLNSRVCFWYLSTLTPMYSEGYVMLEPKSLHDLPVPDPRTIDRHKYIAIVSLVKERVALGDSPKGMLLQNKIENHVIDLYKLDEDEKRYFNIA